jgi:hypothetical protein
VSRRISFPDTVSATPNARPKWRIAVCHLLPLALLVTMYGPSMRAWFQQDDFAWLHLNRWMPAGSSFWYQMFSPQAQGTIRPLGDRLFFTTIVKLFGVNAVPFHVVILATQAISVVLLVKIVHRVLGAPVYGALAALLWTVNSAMATPMTWASPYNQVLWGCLVLAAFSFRVQYEDTRAKRYLWAEWAAFLLGFGALELNVVYPLIAMCYVALYSKGTWKSLLPHSMVAAVYAVAHVIAAPLPKTGAYATAWDLRIFSTLAQYWNLALGPLEHARIRGLSQTAAWAATALITLAAVILILTAIRFVAAAKPADETSPGVGWARAALLGAVWFIAPLMPVLILPDHVSGYYLFVASAGIGMLGAAGLAATRNWWSRAFVCAVLVLYAGTNIPAAYAVRDWTIDRTLQVKALYDALAQIRRQIPPGTCVLLSRVTNDQFWAGYEGVRQYVPELQNVFLAPGADASISPPGAAVKYVMDSAEAREKLQSGSCAAFDIRNGEARKIAGTRLE